MVLLRRDWWGHRVVVSTMFPYRRLSCKRIFGWLLRPTGLWLITKTCNPSEYSPKSLGNGTDKQWSRPRWMLRFGRWISTLCLPVRRLVGNGRGRGILRWCRFGWLWHLRRMHRFFPWFRALELGFSPWWSRTQFEQLANCAQYFCELPCYILRTTVATWNNIHAALMHDWDELLGKWFYEHDESMCHVYAQEWLSIHVYGIRYREAVFMPYNMFVICIIMMQTWELHRWQHYSFYCVTIRSIYFVRRAGQKPLPDYLIKPLYVPLTVCPVKLR